MAVDVYACRSVAFCAQIEGATVHDEGDLLAGMIHDDLIARRRQRHPGRPHMLDTHARWRVIN